MFEWYDLNARHEATALWVIALLGVSFVTSPGVRGAFFSILRAFTVPSISLLIIGLIANTGIVTAAAVIVGRKVGFWETLPIVTATMWLLTAGFALLFNLQDFVHGSKEFRRRAVAVLGPSAVLAAIVGTGVLELWLELSLVPILLITVVAVHRSSSTIVIALSSATLLGYIAGLISLTVIELMDAPENWESVAQAILLPAVLTIGTLPYIRLVIEIERYTFRIGVRSKTVKSSDYGKDWPLTVDSAKLCYKSKAVWVEVNGRKYWLNGFAKGFLNRCGYPGLDLTDIWREHPDREKWIEELAEDGALEHWKVPIDRLLKDGFALEHL